MIYTIVYRCFSICSSFSRFHIELQNIKEIFRKIGYPKQFIDRCIKTFFDKLYTFKPIVSTVEKKNLLLVLPYLGIVSQQIHKKLYKTIKDIIPCCKINLVFKTQRKLSNFFSYKDRICKDLTSGIVYKFQCGGCNASYYGQTKRHFKVRVSEHMGVSPLTGKVKPSSIYTKNTAVKEHMLSCNHRVYMDDFSILAHAESTFFLELKESLFIMRDNPVLNRTISSVPLLLYG